MANALSPESIRALLVQGVDAFNTWRLENLDVRLNLHGVSFEKMDLSRVLLVNADLEKAWFEECSLNHAVFCSSNMEGADFLNAQITYAIFGPPELINVALDQRLASWLVKGANLRGANFRGADLTGSVLRETDLEGADFGYTHLDYVDFRLAKLERACFERANFAETLLDGKLPRTDEEC